MIDSLQTMTEVLTDEREWDPRRLFVHSKVKSSLESFSLDVQMSIEFIPTIDIRSKLRVPMSSEVAHHISILWKDKAFRYKRAQIGIADSTSHFLNNVDRV